MLGNPSFEFPQRQRKIPFLISKEKSNIYIVIVYPLVKQTGREFEHPSRNSVEVNE
jgi:hypothetical protein